MRGRLRQHSIMRMYVCTDIEVDLVALSGHHLVVDGWVVIGLSSEKSMFVGRLLPGFISGGVIWCVWGEVDVCRGMRESQIWSLGKEKVGGLLCRGEVRWMRGAGLCDT